MIQKPYTIAEIKAKVASNDYSAELMLQHAMLHLDALAAQPARAGGDVRPDYWKMPHAGHVISDKQKREAEARTYDPFDLRPVMSVYSVPLYASHAAAALAAASLQDAAEQIEHLDVRNHALKRGMRALMSRLAALLDEDKFKDCEDILRRAGVSPADGFSTAEVAALAAAPQPAPAEHLSEDIEAMAVARYKVVPAHSSMFWSHAVVAGDGQQQLYVGRELECRNMAAKFAGAFLDGAFVAKQPAPAEPATPQQEVSGAHHLTDAQITGLQEVALSIFNVPGAPQETRDVIEWFIGMLRVQAEGAARAAATTAEQPAGGAVPAERELAPGSLTIHESLWAEVLRYADTEIPPNPDRMKAWAAAIRKMEEQTAVDAVPAYAIRKLLSTMSSDNMIVRPRAWLDAMDGLRASLSAAPAAVERDACTDSQRLGFVLEHLLGKRDLAALVSIAHDEDGFRLSDDEVLQGIDAAIRGIGSSKEGGDGA